MDSTKITSSRAVKSDAKSRKSSLDRLYLDCDSPLGVSDYHDPDRGTLFDVFARLLIVFALACLGAVALGWLR